MIRIKERQNETITLEVSGKLDAQDYAHLLPQLEQAVESHGRVKALIELKDFEGWTPQGLAEELKFDIRHRQDVERCAILGEKSAEEWMAKVAAPLFSGEVKFFPKSESLKAKAWLDSSQP